MTIAAHKKRRPPDEKKRAPERKRYLASILHLSGIYSKAHDVFHGRGLSLDASDDDAADTTRRRAGQGIRTRELHPDPPYPRSQPVPL
jgi:hypothetical protein